MGREEEVEADPPSRLPDSGLAALGESEDWVCEISSINSHAVLTALKGPTKRSPSGGSAGSFRGTSQSMGLTINACLPNFSAVFRRSVGRMPGESGVPTSAYFWLSHFNVSKGSVVDVVVAAGGLVIFGRGLVVFVTGVVVVAAGESDF